jgi:hypothetical protein
MTYNYLPGTQITTVQGGLITLQAPQDKAILVFGTAAQGPADQPYQVTDQTLALTTFGLRGDLMRAMAEAMVYSDNVVLYRVGTSPLSLSAIGLDHTTGAATPGFSVAFGNRTATSKTDYTVWYKAGILYVYYQGAIVYSNDPAAAVDTGDVTITGTIAGNVGLQLGTGTSASAASAVTVLAASQETGTANEPAPTMVDAVDGITPGLGQRDLYVAVSQALGGLQGYQASVILVPSAKFDTPNIAFYVASDPTTAINNPASNPDALDWLEVVQNADGSSTYTWAGSTAFANAAARIAAGFHEVSWGFLLGNFCAQLEKLDTVCVAFLGTSAPATLKLADVRAWIGAPTVYGPDGATPATAGRGLLGNAYMVGTTAAKLNPLCGDYSNGHRMPGFFETSTGFYDGGFVLDPVKQLPNDIGRFLHIVADLGVLSNAYASNYVANLANLVGGFYSAIDPKSAIWNKGLQVTQIPGLTYTPTQMDALTFAKFNVLRSKGANVAPVLLHDRTAAIYNSDFTFLLRMNIHGLVIDTICQRADQYEGQSSLDGLQMTSMKSAMDQDMVTLQTRGYISKANITISTTQAQQNMGQTNLYCSYSPADELVQLFAFVSLAR